MDDGPICRIGCSFDVVPVMAMDRARVSFHAQVEYKGRLIIARLDGGTFLGETAETGKIACQKPKLTEGIIIGAAAEWRASAKLKRLVCA